MVGGLYGLYNLLPFIIEIFVQYPNKSNQHQCAGSLIANDWVLTAAHCIKPNLKAGYYLGAGRTDSSHKLTKHGHIKFYFGQTRRVGDIFIHEDFDNETVLNDIALVKPKVPFKDSLNIIPIALPTKTEKGDLSELFKYCHSGGWGLTGANIMIVYDHKSKNWTYNQETGKATKLSHVVLPLISNKQCKRLQFRAIFVAFDVVDTQMCTLYYPGRKSLCRGDSGGPLVCGSKLYGVATWSFQCGAPRIGADVFTRVDKYLEWINETMKKSPTYMNNEMQVDEDYYDLGDLIEFRSGTGSRNTALILTFIFNYLFVLLIM